jgi:peptide/nickel transport system substrate-binding protein
LRAGLSLALGALLLAACSSAAPAVPTTAPKADTKTAAPAAAPAAPVAPAASPAAAQPAAASPAAQVPAAKPAGPEPKRGGTLRVTTSGDWRTLDPPVYASIPDRQVLYSIYNPLVAMDENLTIVPELARSWQVSPDGLTWTFSLAKGVKFHDGTPFNAQAVKFNLDRLLDPNTASRLRQEVLEIKEVQVVDDSTVKIIVAAPFTPLLAWLTDAVGMISSPTAIQKWGKEYGDHPVGTGPFEFVEQVKGDHITLRKFKDYWEPGLPYLDEVVFRPIPDPSTKLAGLRSGALDVVDEIPSRDVAGLRQAGEFKLGTMEGTRWRVVHLNLTKPPLDNVAIRQALSLAVDRDAIVRAVYFGNAGPLYGPISPIYKAIYDPTVADFGYKRDLAKAKQKLAEGGQPNGFKITLEIAATPEVTRMAELIKAQWAEIGVNTEIATFDSNTVPERARAGTFESSLLSWTPRPDPDGTLRRNFYSTSPLNYSRYKSTKVDELLDLTRRLQPGAERTQAFRDFQRQVVQDAPWVFLVSENQALAMAKPVEGLPPIPDTLLRPKTVWLNK